MKKFSPTAAERRARLFLPPLAPASGARGEQRAWAMIQFICPCGKSLQAKEERVGLQIICPGCGQMQVVPGDPTAIRPLAPAAPPSEHLTDRPPAGLSPGPERFPRSRGRAPTLSGKALASLILGALTF